MAPTRAKNVAAPAPAPVSEDEDDDAPTMFDRIEPLSRELSEHEKRLLEGCKKPRRQKYTVPPRKPANSKRAAPVKKPVVPVVNSLDDCDGGDLPEIDDPVAPVAVLNDSNGDGLPSSSGSRSRPKLERGSKGSENKSEKTRSPSASRSRHVETVTKSATKKQPELVRSKTAGPAVPVDEPNRTVNSDNKTNNNGRKRTAATEPQNSTKKSKETKKISPGEEDLRELKEAIEKKTQPSSTRAKRGK